MMNNEMDNTELRELLEAWARQKLVADQAQKTLANLATAIKDGFGNRKGGVFSENAVVTKVVGRRRYDYIAASADVPQERYSLYSKMKTDYRAMCKGEGINQDDIPFTRGEDTIKVELATGE